MDSVADARGHLRELGGGARGVRATARRRRAGSSKGCVPDASPTAPVEPEDPGGPPPCLCARVFAARSAAAANSRVRSFTDADIAADISPSSLVDEGSRDADEFPVERCGRDGLGYAEAPDAAPGRVGAGTATVEGHS